MRVDGLDFGAAAAGAAVGKFLFDFSIGQSTVVALASLFICALAAELVSYMNKRWPIIEVKGIEGQSSVEDDTC